MRGARRAATLCRSGSRTSGCSATVSPVTQMARPPREREPIRATSTRSPTLGALPLGLLQCKRTRSCGRLIPPTLQPLSRGNVSDGRQSNEGRMNRADLPQHLLVKLLALDEAVAALMAGADAVERGIEDRRARLWGNVRRADDNPRALEAELEKFVADQKLVQKQLAAEQSVLSACKTWVDRLPAGTKLEP